MKNPLQKYSLSPRYDVGKALSVYSNNFYESRMDKQAVRCREGYWLMSIYFAEVDALKLSRTAAMMEVDE
jgi:hypothetical protein